MRVHVLATADAVARSLAAQVARVVNAAPRVVLGLPTGRTPIPLYRALVALHQRKRIAFSPVTTFNLDEFVGISRDDPRSYYAFMQAQLFGAVGLRARQIHFLNGLAPDLAVECERYERAIARAGGIDLQILGLGTNGHIGFNEPARALAARTHQTRLRSSTRHANASLFGRVSAVPKDALSMGMGTILHARRIVMVATGKSKAACVARMIEGPVTPMLPASFLQLHPAVDIWLDADAASRLTKR